MCTTKPADPVVECFRASCKVADSVSNTLLLVSLVNLAVGGIGWLSYSLFSTFKLRVLCSDIKDMHYNLVQSQFQTFEIYLLQILFENGRT